MSTHIHQQTCHKRGHSNCDKCRPCPECKRIDADAVARGLKVTRISKAYAEQEDMTCQTPHATVERPVTRIRIGYSEVVLCKECTEKVHQGTRLR